MAPLTFLDHLFFVVVMLVIPLHSWRTFPSALEEIRKKGEPELIRSYRFTILTFAIAATVVLLMWFAYDRDWSRLGFQFVAGWKQLAAAAVVLGGLAMFVLPVRAIALAIESGKDSHSAFENIGDLSLFLPCSRREEAWFYVVSLNAGISEEVVFRGYLFWYLLHFVGTGWAGIGWAAIASVLLFGFAHLYQGLKQLPGILAVSATTVLIYVVSQSLLLPMLFHILVDALQGRYISRLNRALKMREPAQRMAEPADSVQTGDA